MNSNGRPAPLIWLLSGDKGGDTAQLRVLARALGWPVVEKPLQFNGLYRLPNWLLGASVASLADASRAALVPPWPDLLLSAGRRTTPVANWVRARTDGAAKLVNIGRPWGSLASFDLVIAMPQYRLPASPNVLQAHLPFNRVDPIVLKTAAAEWASRLGDLKPPYLTLLIGGYARPLKFDAGIGRTIGRQVDALARATNASVLAVSSRRTPAEAAAALVAEIKAPLLVHPWRAGDNSNAYAAFIGLADRIVVTGDSGSMIAEACHTGKPVSVAPVPLSGSLREVLSRLAWKLLPRRTLDSLHAGGWIVPPRDIAALWRPLAHRHNLHVLGKPLATTSPPPDDLPAAVERIRALLG